MNESIRVFLADDHTVLRAGLKALLSAELDMDVVGEAGGDGSCADAIVAQDPDVVLLDINMPCCNGLELLKELRQRAPNSGILVLTMHDDMEYLRQVLATGGAGYVLKEAADTELLTAIRTVHGGGVFLHPEHAALLTNERFDPSLASQPCADPVMRLSAREEEVLRLIALGYSNKEIAEMLSLSVKTVETYKARIMDKLDLRSRAALVRFALQQGLMDQTQP